MFDKLKLVLEIVKENGLLSAGNPSLLDEARAELEVAAYNALVIDSYLSVLASRDAWMDRSPHEDSNHCECVPGMALQIGAEYAAMLVARDALSEKLVSALFSYQSIKNKSGSHDDVVAVQVLIERIRLAKAVVDRAMEFVSIKEESK